MNIFGRNHFYLKNTHVLEKMMRITHIVFDKTGTLTQSNKGSIHFNGNPLNNEEKGLITQLLSQSTHPLSRQIVASLNTSGITYPIQHFQEIKGKGISGRVKNQDILIGSGDYLNESYKSASTSSDKNDFSHSQVHVSIGNQYRGYFSIQNNYRKGLRRLIEELNKFYKLSILSGDRETERKNLQPIFPEGTMMKFNQKPDEKLLYIQSIQGKGERVLMLGDGLNDAGALIKSDLGIAVTEDITSFTPASDAIIDAGKLDRLDKFIRFSLSAKHIIYLSFTISFLYNIIGMSFAVMGKLTPIIAAILMPASSITVVIFATFTVNLMARIKKLI
jgi:Cu+-exporting ATPase